MVGMLFNNILYCFSDIYIISYILDFIIGNSITTTFLLYVCSYVFGFCKWHRFIITANIINLLIANLDAYYRIPISDIFFIISSAISIITGLVSSRSSLVSVSVLLISIPEEIRY